MRAYSSDDEADLVRAEQDVRDRVGDLDIDFAALAAVSNVFRVANAVRNHMERDVLRPDELSWTGFVVLFVLWVWGEQESRHLADESGISKGTLTGVVSTLERRGLVQRRGLASDKRLVVVSITSAGADTIRRLFPRFNAHETMVTARLDDAQTRQLAHLLREVLRSVEAVGE